MFNKFKKLMWDSGAWIGIIIMFAGILFFCIPRLMMPSYLNMRSGCRNITNSLIAWQNGTQLPNHYNVEYIKKSDVFHNPFCRSIREIKTKECTKDKAVSKGLLPCKTCKP